MIQQILVMMKAFGENILNNMERNQEMHNNYLYLLIQGMIFLLSISFKQEKYLQNIKTHKLNMFLFVLLRELT